METPDSLKVYMDKKGNEELAADAKHQHPGSELLTERVTQKLLPRENITRSLSKVGYLLKQDSLEKKKAKFYQLASETAGSEEFLQELSDKTGVPHEEESKDVYVERVVQEAKQMLYKKLKIKDK